MKLGLNKMLFAASPISLKGKRIRAPAVRRSEASTRHGLENVACSSYIRGARVMTTYNGPKKSYIPLYFTLYYVLITMNMYLRTIAVTYKKRGEAALGSCFGVALGWGVRVIR